MNVHIFHELPRIREYMELRLDAGLPEIEGSIAQTALAGSLLSILVRDGNDRLIGMGRVVGDGAFYFQLVDLVVAPSHQGQGLKEKMIGQLLNRVKEMAPTGTEVTVMTDLPGIKLYQNAGFKLVYPDRYGMSRRL